MFCNQCGKEVPNNANVCPYCGKALKQGQVSGGQQPSYEQDSVQSTMSMPSPEPSMGMQGGSYQTRRRRAGIDNIFSSLLYDRTLGTGLEFALWCTVCVLVVLALIAVATVDREIIGRLAGNFRALWIMVMLMGAGMGTGMVFRKMKPVMILAGLTVFQFILLIPYYMVVGGLVDDYNGEVPGILTALFILLLLAGIGVVACGCVQFFTRFRMGLVVSIISMSSAFLAFVLSMCLYFAPEEHRWYRSAYSDASFALGSVAYVGICLVVAAYTALFFFGLIENKRDKIYVIQGNAGMGRMPSFQPGLQCLQGNYMGQTLYLQGQELTLGSAYGVHILIQDPYISERHCSIRFNMASGYYEILDSSSSGVFLSNGMRLQQGVYSSVRRGEVICIGSMGQQFRLM